uniref:Uncharacterized protein n=1 Tax=Lactuca sativa TaxID=4236 RepID=A0A9R1WFQ1_LACSA|nr:hypothetical protein LSAT_V11C100007960 [Lactuca sativa]
MGGGSDDVPVVPGGFPVDSLSVVGYRNSLAAEFGCGYGWSSVAASHGPREVHTKQKINMFKMEEYKQICNVFQWYLRQCEGANDAQILSKTQEVYCKEKKKALKNISFWNVVKDKEKWLNNTRRKTSRVVQKEQKHSKTPIVNLRMHMLE